MRRTRTSLESSDVSFLLNGFLINLIPFEAEEDQQLNDAFYIRYKERLKLEA